VTKRTAYLVDRADRCIRSVKIASEAAVPPSRTDYYRIKVGIQTADTVSWRWTFDGATQQLRAGASYELSEAGATVKLSEGSLVVFDVATVGAPPALDGASLVLHIGTTTTFPVSKTEDRASRAAIESAMGTLLGTGAGEERIVRPLAEAVDKALAGSSSVSHVFQGRMQRDSATAISIQRYTGDVCMVAGVPVSLTDAGISCTTSNSLIDANGNETGAAPGTSTLYYVYLSKGGQLRLSATAPTLADGGYYLGAASRTTKWRFVGWVRTNSSTQFVNDTTDRLVINYHNRRPLPLLVAPAYNDNNALTSYTTTSTTFTAANAGTGATGSYIANGEDAVDLSVVALVANSGAQNTVVGLGDNSSSAAVVEAASFGTSASTISCRHASTPSSGYRTAVLLVRVTGGTGTYYADDARGGSAADPKATYLTGWVMG
jgi:hypothetical protein